MSKFTFAAIPLAVLIAAPLIAASATLTPPPPMMLSAHMTQFVGTATGTVSLAGSGSGGTPGYTYTWLENGHLYSNSQSVILYLDPSTVNTYKVELLVKDSLGNIATTDLTLVTTGPPPHP